ncbi:VapE domain-containing protein [Ralstonia pseudosolanacearum]|uniref:VapE domain-containing protein n=1 Tax=Ralstonia pseudosolanacearum TaxID=1310165 RepID=UPI000B92EB2D|nr:VapE domain-containing protein [Ralstonia pseudosolanacearum]MCD9228944.1 toprim domain-containing protein [Ralstonia pseudosolanacearum]
MSATIQTHADVVGQFRDAMAEQGIVITGEIVADGRLHRYHVDGDKKGQRNAWAILHIDDKPAGAFGCNRRYGHDQKFTWTGKATKPLTAAERRVLRERVEQQKREREVAERARHEHAAAMALQLWDAAEECQQHPYLTRKQIQSHGLRIGKWEKVDEETGDVRLITKQALLIPIRDAKKQIHSLQAIFPRKLMGDRDKDYLTGGNKAGHFYSIGKPVEFEGRIVIIICEGYATGASLHEATGHAVIVAFDAPNLLPVALVIRARFPAAIIIMAADNDQWTLKPVANPGVTRAREAALAIGGLLAVPPFDASLGAVGEGGPTDFNDLHVRQGAQAVSDIIDDSIDEASRVLPVLFVPACDPMDLDRIQFAADAVAAFDAAQATRLSRRGVVLMEYRSADDLRSGIDSTRRFMPNATLQILAAPGQERVAQELAQETGATARLPEAGSACWADTLWDDFRAVTGLQTLMKSAARANVALASQGDHDPTAPIAMGVSGDLFGFWTREGKVELIRAGDVFKDAGILRLQDLAYWQAYCTAAGVSTTGGKYDRTMVGNQLIQKSKLVGTLDARNVPASVASPDLVQRELNLALMHAKPNAHAVAQVLLAHPDWRGVVWMNTFAERAEARVDPPCGGAAGPWTDRHDMLLGAWLSAQYGVSVSKSMVVAAVGLLAHADQRHPVRVYLNSLAWDGAPRLDIWLTTFAGCEDDTYARHVGAKTLIGAVARIMEPGVKFDTMLVLEGDQGLRKSTLICALAPNEEWFTDSLDGDLGSKDAAIGLAGKWLIEVPEMATLGRTRVEVVKSFLTRRVDHFRAPHAVRAEDHPRQCAFFGTINPEADGRYLSDTTGGRRFWPVQVRRADVEALKTDRDQLWAEAVARYRAGEHWWLTDEVEILAKQQQADRQESNPWAEHVEQFLTRLPPDEHNREWGGIRASRVDEVSAAEIFAAITGKHMTKKDSPDARLISAALKATGWVQKSDKSRRWVHE